MSADNWSTCPRCVIRVAKERAEALRLAKASYGKVDAEAYLKNVKDAEAMPEEPNEQTMREDYYIGVDSDGMFRCKYTAFCECGFEYEFKHEVDAETPAARRRKS